MAKVTKEEMEAKKAEAAAGNAEKPNIIVNIKKATIVIIGSDNATGYDEKAHTDFVKKKNKGMVSSVYTNTKKVPGKKKTID
jgi:hypothetical protein